MSNLYAVLQLSPRTLSQDNLNMPGVDQDKAKDIFNLFDKDGDCSIPTQELGTAMRAMGTFPKERELEKLIEMEDEISFEQYIQLVHRQKENGCENVENIKEAFLSVCPVVEGRMTMRDLESILRKNTGEQLESEEIVQVQRALVEFAENDNTFDLKELLDVILEDLELKSASSSCTRS